MRPRDRAAEIALLRQDRDALRHALGEVGDELRRAEEEAVQAIADWTATAAESRRLRAALSRCQDGHAGPGQGEPDATA